MILNERVSGEDDEEDSCQSGTQAGIDSVNRLWASPPFNSDCSEVWSLPMSAEAMKNSLYPSNTGNWQTDAYNQCARDFGVDPQVAEIEKQCLGDDPDQCIDLGETAASIIVYQKVCMTYNAANYQSYLQTCRDVAIDICEGSIHDKIMEQCSGKWTSITTITLSELMGMCEDQVNSMVPISTETPTFMPTKISSGDRSDRNECRGGYPYDSGTFCFEARQQCCSSVKKYDQWQSFCRYYGLPYPAELSGSITPWLFNAVDCTMCGSVECTAVAADLTLGGIEAELDGLDIIFDDEDSADFEDEDTTDRRPTKKPTRKPNGNRNRRPTKKPTKKPNGNRSGRNECKGGYPYDSGTFCFDARQQCCSSVKKYDQWESFCRYYGLPYPGGLFGGITPWLFNSVDCTMCGSIEAELDGVDIISDDEDSAGFEDEDTTNRRPTKKPTKKPNGNRNRRPTKKPTKKPKGDRSGRNECRGGYPYDSGTFCFDARQQCCSSVKKYDQWESFCRYYGLPDPAELSGSITPWLFNSVDCTMCGSAKCALGDSDLDVGGIEAEFDGVDIISDDEDSAGFEDEDIEDAFVSPQ
ncbi:hypothetical protein ACHAXA_008820 [Cyclostephanos tholiformis]|uniref:Uncharacterized protein n=1 Tax=Cyclostephanos tholiformis TaxID=382380 RepID=A0ABD3RS35_9STRA